MYKRLRKLFLNYIPILVKVPLLQRIPFLYPALQVRPSSSTILITDRCNLRCLMCKQWRKTGKKELKTEEWKRIIDDLKSNGIKNIHFSGGEPLLRKDLKELVSYASSNGFTVGMTTNGILLTKEILEGLVEAGLRSVAISVDAIGEDYDKIRGVENSFDKLKNALSAIRDVRKNKNIDSYINFTLMKDSLKKLGSVKELGDSFGIPIAVCLLDKSSEIFSLNENKDKFWIKKEEDLKELDNVTDYIRAKKTENPGSFIINFPSIDFIKNYFKDPVQKSVPCTSSQDRIIIDPYGNFLGGCMAMGSFGNIREESLKAISKKEKYIKAKRNMFYKNCAGCSCGYVFNIRTMPGLVVKDLFEKIRCSRKN